MIVQHKSQALSSRLICGGSHNQDDAGQGQRESVPDFLTFMLLNMMVVSIPWLKIESRWFGACFFLLSALWQSLQKLIKMLLLFNLSPKTVAATATLVWILVLPFAYFKSTYSIYQPILSYFSSTNYKYNLVLSHSRISLKGKQNKLKKIFWLFSSLPSRYWEDPS